MNKKLLILGLIVIIGTGFYMNGLVSHDNVITTAAGTNVTVPYKHFDLQSNNSAEVFGNEFQDQFTYVIAFNATENPEMYNELCNIVCQGQRYKDQETGVIFYQDVSKELVNSHRFMFGKGLALKDTTFNGGVMLNNETGECIIVVSTIGQDVIEILSSIEWGNKNIAPNTTVNTDENATTTLLTSSDDSSVSEPVKKEKTYDNADGIGLSDDKYSKEHQKEIDAYEKGLEDAGYFDDFEEEELPSSDSSESSALK